MVSHLGSEALSAHRVDSPFRSPRAPAGTPPTASTVAERSMQRRNLSLGGGLALRAMTGYEEEFLEAHLAESNTVALCNELVARCLVPPGQDHAGAMETVLSWSPAKRDEALVELRRLSLGETVCCEVSCVKCTVVNEVTFDLSTLPPVPGESAESVDCELDDGRRASLRPINAADQAALVSRVFATTAERSTWLLSRTLRTVGSDVGPFSEDQVRAMPVAVRNSLSRELANSTAKLDLTMGVCCHDCGHEFSAPFDIVSFFLPSLGGDW